jgi:hypothetical protein
VTASPDPRWPGERLGLPATGKRSIARLGRRIGALFIDWGTALLISFAFFESNSWITLAVFAVAQLAFLWIVNGSVGHLLLGMRVVPILPARLGLWRPVVRTVLLCLAIPPLIFDRDQRGLHDRVAGTLLVRV